jgi:uncharacterized protein (TIGR02145 family)
MNMQGMGVVRRKAIILLALFYIAACVSQKGSLAGSKNFTDPRDKKIYKSVKIGSQTWMAENLSYSAEGSACYDSKPDNCAKYGRLYDWATAMVLPSSCNSSSCSGQVSAKHRGICPSGWHIPSNAEWNELYHYADGTLNGSTNLSSNCDSPTAATAGKHLKATSGWNQSGNGLDSYGFSALPGGFGNSGSNFYVVGNYGKWWSSLEDYGYINYAYNRGMGYNYESAYCNYNDKSNLYSVRCVKD